MLNQVKYSELIFDKIKDIQGSANSIISYYRKGYHYHACVAINLIIITRLDGLAIALIYQDCNGEIVHRSLRNNFKFIYNQNQSNEIKLYDTLFTELVKEGVVIEELNNNNERSYNMSQDEVFGPAYFNLDGYSVCLFNDEYSYDNLKPLGSYIGHVLTGQPFSYQNYLTNLFIKNEDCSYDSDN